MQDEAARIATFGTPETPPAAQHVRVGDLELLIDGDMIRAISWKGVEVVRAISWPVRDESWITLPQTIMSEKLDNDGENAIYEIAFQIADGALDCRLRADFRASGAFEANLEMVASRDFDTNRAGFTLLHPLEGVAGAPLTIAHSDGSTEESHFPQRISPDQPAMDIVGLRHEVAGVNVDITFSGEIFEMEDQRNWTDASYKTYCRPLVFPFTYTIAKGETVSQKIHVDVNGGSEKTAADAGSAIGLANNGRFPAPALALESGWLDDGADTAVIENTGIKTLQLRTGPDHDGQFLSATAALGKRLGAEIDVEIVLPADAAPEGALERAGDALSKAGISPARVIALPEPYLKSYQPSGPWPDGPTPADAARAARAVFGDCEIGGGVLTNFTEYNRCRPDPSSCDYVSHSSTAIVHAADDRSVTETLEALPYVYESAIEIGEGKPYRLGLVTIGMRSNPYGAGVAENPDQTRKTMAMYDPRQRGLYAAAFAVGSLAVMAGHKVETVALAAPSGPFAILAEKSEVSRPYFDQHDDAAVYPLYHVVRAAAQMAGRPRLRVTGLPPMVRAAAAGDSAAPQMMIANLGEEAAMVSLPASAPVRLLDTGTFEAAVGDPSWLENAPASKVDSIVLPPCSVAFVSGGDA